MELIKIIGGISMNVLEALEILYAGEEEYSVGDINSAYQMVKGFINDIKEEVNKNPQNSIARLVAYDNIKRSVINGL